jgi:RNA polymerase sigma-70 factor (ECF subfamily)
VKRNPRELDSNELLGHTRALRGLAKAMVGDEHAAQDVVQDAFVTAMEKPSKPGWSIGRWLSGITRNHARDHVREERRRNLREQVAAKPDVAEGDDSLVRVDLLQHLLVHVRGLEEPYRSTILLRFFDGLSPKAVATRQGVPYATVRTRLRRSIELLRDKMDGSSGGRRAWVAPLIPFISVVEGGPLTALAEGAARVSEFSGQGVGLMAAKKTAILVFGLIGVAVVTGRQLWLANEAKPSDTITDLVVPSEQERTQPAKLADARPVRVEGDTVVPDAALKSAAAGLRITVRGTVRGADGTLLGGATVWANKETTKTAIDGIYSFALPTKQGGEGFNLFMRAESQGWAPQGKDFFVSADASPAQFDFMLQSAVVVSGRVVDQAGKGFEGALVRTFRRGERPLRTADDGSFRITDLDATVPQHFVYASAEGFVGAGKMVRSYGRGERSVVLELKPGSQVHGVVFGPQRRPVANAKVSMWSFKSLLTAKTDVRGLFRFSGARPGKTELTVEHAEFAMSVQKIEVPALGRSLEVFVQLHRGETIAGVVRSSHGGTVDGAVITVVYRRRKVCTAKSGAEGRFELRGLPAKDLYLTCHSDGFLELREEVAHAGNRQMVMMLRRAGRIAGTAVDAASGELIPGVRVRVMGRSNKRAEDKDQPKGRGKFAGKGKRGEWPTRGADPQGRWVTEDLPEGFVTDVEFRVGGYAPKVVTGLVARIDASPKDHRVALDRGTTLVGTVLSAEGPPLAGATVRQVRADVPFNEKGSGKQRGGLTRCDTLGRFTLPHLTPGPLRLAIEHPDCGLFVHATRIPMGVGRWEETIRAQVQGTLIGVVQTAGGQPIPDAHLVLTVAEVEGIGRKSWRKRADGSGRFTFDRLPFGVYRLARLELAGEKRLGGARKLLPSVSQHVRIKDHLPVRVVLAAAGDATLRGTCSAEVALSGEVWVRLVPLQEASVPWEQRRAARWLRCSNGSFVVGPIERGRYRLEAQSFGGAVSLRGSFEVSIGTAGEQRVHVPLRIVPSGK